MTPPQSKTRDLNLFPECSSKSQKCPPPPASTVTEFYDSKTGYFRFTETRPLLDGTLSSTYSIDSNRNQSVGFQINLLKLFESKPGHSKSSSPKTHSAAPTRGHPLFPFYESLMEFARRVTRIWPDF